VDEQCFLVGDVERQSIYAFNKKGSLLFSFGSDILIAPAGVCLRVFTRESEQKSVKTLTVHDSVRLLLPNH